MGKEKIAHRSSSSTVRVRKLARRRRFSDEVGLWWPATVLRWGGGRGRELDAPRMKNGERRARVTLTVDESRDSGDSRTSTSFGHGRRRGFGQRRRRGRDGARRGEVVWTAGHNAAGRNGVALSGRRRVVPTVHLMHEHGAVCGSHAATACCQAGPTRTAASDRWYPHVSVF
jgi:hypothetical protein